MIRVFIEDNPEIVRPLCGSQLGAIAVMKRDREMAIKALAKNPGQIKDRDILVKSYNDVMTPRRLTESPIRLQLRERFEHISASGTLSPTHSLIQPSL
jgi:hypothetical protein